MIKPRLARPLPVPLLSVAGHGDKYDILEPGLLTELLRYLKAIEARQDRCPAAQMWSVVEGRFHYG